MLSILPEIPKCLKPVIAAFTAMLISVALSVKLPRDDIAECSEITRFLSTLMLLFTSLPVNNIIAF
ncbi:hypothetical protein BAZSYMA_ACONTIG03627_16 [Bathymodiolus azoricus thioautotrophic gill symbiont]|uniref:Uncharacterized protein n=1 Tax=Bathymodiolus azoricus thioautotrophic gill symbiont TaxID=235205 RepID=A0A1H6JXU1_9GAMM|nr:hypothetical protein BAZSYMA_ACONTIG03627_16 [Bathymodiolus azoricus thioautotrophic gill symbiont]